MWFLISTADRFISLCQKIVVFQGRWCLAAVVFQDRFHCTFVKMHSEPILCTMRLVLGQYILLKMVKSLQHSGQLLLLPQIKYSRFYCFYIEVHIQTTRPAGHVCRPKMHVIQ